jgi:hypothetical protein
MDQLVRIFWANLTPFALQLPPEGWLRLATFNCGLTHLAIRATGSVSLWGFGDVGHLDLDKTTYH